ncbi:MAG: ankyrin repeat domain-containing protein [Pseudomonadota bacterium]
MTLAPLQDWEGEPLSIEEAFERIAHFAQAFGAPAMRLAGHCSILERLSFESVGLLRRNFLPSEHFDNAALDGQVLFGGLCLHLGSGYFEMDTEVRRYLRLYLERWCRPPILHSGSSPLTPTQSTARFVRHYVAHLRKTNPSSGRQSFDDYLNMLDWVATGYDEPDTAARRLAEAIVDTHSQLSEGGAIRVRFSALPSLLTLPLGGHTELIRLAKMANALQNRDLDEAERLAGPAPSKSSLTVGGVVLPSHAELLGTAQEHREKPGSTDLLTSPGTLNPSSPSSAGVEQAEEENTAQRHPIFEALARDDTVRALALLDGDRSLLKTFDPDGLLPLHIATQRNQVDLVMAMLDLGMDVNVPTRNGTPPLSLAAAFGHDDLLRVLIRRDADLDACNNDRFTALSWAAYYGHKEVIRTLIREGATINNESTRGAEALFWAVAAGRSEIVDLLLAEGGQWPTQRPGKWSVLHAAASSGHVLLFEQVLENAPEIDPVLDNGYTPFHIAAYHGHAEIVELMAELGADITRRLHEGWNAVHVAAQDHPNAIPALLRYGVPADLRVKPGSYTALHIACAHNCFEAVTMLLQASVDVNVRAHKSTPFLTASQKGFVETVTRLLEVPELNLTDEDGDGRDAMTLALRATSDDTVAVIWRSPRFDPNRRCSDSKNGEHILFEFLKKVSSVPLRTEAVRDPRVSLTEEEWRSLSLLACKAEIGHPEVFSAVLDRCDSFLGLDYLLDGMSPAAPWLIACVAERGQRFDGLDPAGRNLLHHVKDASVLNAIMQVAPQVSVDTPDLNGMTPLMTAAQNGRLEAVQTLLGLGADVNCEANTGWNALHFCAQTGALDVFKALISAGADPARAAGDPVMTPLAIAIEVGANDALAELLRLGQPISSARKGQYGPLALAAKSGDLTTIKSVLRACVAADTIDAEDVASAVELLNARQAAELEIWGNESRTDGNVKALFDKLASGAPLSASDLADATPPEPAKPRSPSRRDQT